MLEEINVPLNPNTFNSQDKHKAKTTIMETDQKQNFAL